MINTQDETRNHLRNPQGHESPKHTAQVLTQPTDTVTIIDRTLVNQGYTYTITNPWEQGPGLGNESSGGIRDSTL